MKAKLKANSLQAVDYDEPNRLLPSWLISLVLHGLLLGVVVIGSDRRGTPEGSGEEFRDVGLISKDELPDAVEAAVGGGAADATPPATSTAVDEPLLAEQQVESEPALPLQLPTTPTIGAGPTLPMNLPSAAAAGAAKAPNTGRVRGATGGEGGLLGPRFGRTDGTSFFQVAAQGDHFVYVVDCSGSMDENNAIGVARAELMASIERLDPSKRFQILFYDSDLHPMLNGKQEIFFATDINRTFARQFINNQQPDSGTMHFPALKWALSMAPDVVFFLTDGDDPELSFRELRDLRGLNRQNTKVHVIQFGKGAKLGPLNWLEQLAKDHQGTYRYRDVKAFRE